LNYGPILAAALLAAAPTQNAADLVRASVPASNNAAAVAATPVTRSVPSGPAVGDRAPDFTYQTREYLWQNLHNMLEQGSVLLVFGATDDELLTLERDQEDLVGHGAMPVAVVTQRESEVWRTVRREGLTYSLLADPHAAISEQYGALDHATHKPRPLWLVIDRTGRVRATGEGVSSTRSWTAIAATALGQRDVRTASTR
jgi:peroxiredoxin